MKTMIIHSGYYFPLSALAGAILTGEMPAEYSPGVIWKMPFAAGHKNYSDGEMCFSGLAADGTRVVAFSVRSGRVILKNLITTFPEIHGIAGGDYSILGITVRPGISFSFGQWLLRVFPDSGTGRYMVEKNIKKIYPDLVKSVKLDCYCQISDN